MSLRIKIPPAKSLTMDESSSSGRRNKRRSAAVYTSDEDGDQETAPSPPKKRLKKSYDDEDLNVDVDASDSNEGKGNKRLLKKRTKASSSKKHRVADESEDDFDVDVVSDEFDLETGGTDDEGEDDFIDVVDIAPKKSKIQPAGKGKGGKLAKGKGKGKAESQEKEIIVRDERQGVNGQVASSTAKIRIKPSMSVDTIAAAEPSPDVATQDLDAVKKRKLPNIKKNKSLASGTPATPTPKLGASTTKNTATTTTDGAPATPVSAAARLSAAHLGSDFNLQNPDVYKSIFKDKPGNRTNEERKKQLDALREADKARRANEAKHHFDLQAQMDKISAFEDRLRRHHNSAVLYPNILGAKMRDLYEKEKKAREPQEEGEMPASS